MREKSRHDNEPLAWLVRGGRDGEIESEALAENLAIVAWRGIGDISTCENWQALKAEVRRPIRRLLRASSPTGPAS
ncbi:hypothetical protein ACLQ2R_08220 [Streptosporangium sp. DT93]|uniref:hypothetical protein n=1 Tax=Streptosporangium sp. DT93 TaxID=3393428 RepID=UPI003CF14A95